MTTPTERLWRHRIGTLEGVAADRFSVILDLDAPESTALNTGSPKPFPRVNSYLVVPTESGTVVGIVTRLQVERTPFPKRKGLSDFDIVDLPFPQRQVRLVPVGTLQERIPRGRDTTVLKLDRGVHSFPSVGDPVLLPTDEQLDAIIDATRDAPGVTIGRSPIAADAEIAVNPNRLFGRHLAVLGNTGSGKSCTVAGLLRWSLKAKERNAEDSGFCRFLVLDPNGEYAQAFDDMGSKVAVYQVDPEGDGANPLKVPAWMWNLQEWTAFARATPATQRPVLQEALRQLRGGTVVDDSIDGRIFAELTARARWFQQLIRGPRNKREDFPHTRHLAKTLETAEENASGWADELPDDRDAKDTLTQFSDRVEELLEEHVDPGEYTNYDPWPIRDLEELRDLAFEVIDTLGEPEETAGVDPDAPIQFDVSDLPSHLDLVASQQAGRSLGQWIGTLSMRIEMLLSDPRMEGVLQPDEPPSLSGFLADVIGGTGDEDPDIVIFDLSLVPTNVVHILVAVLSRLIFEALQRYRRSTREALPTALILEEAHTFIHNRRGGQDEHTSPQQMCRATFDRIAREGRKFGLGLVLASQRPAELSQTVLSQCNTFILHRIVNDRDQQLVNRLVPEALGELLRDLQSLPTRQAVLLGWAAPIPLLVEISELDLSERPQSEDPKFWSAWTEGPHTPPDWDAISADWTGIIN